MAGMEQLELWEWWVTVAGKRRRTGYVCTEREIRTAHPEAEQVAGTARPVASAKALTMPRHDARASVPAKWPGRAAAGWRGYKDQHL